MSNKIAFIGKMFSGKTTAAERLVAHDGFVKLAFADPVKHLSAEILNYMNAFLRIHDTTSEHQYVDWTYEDIQRRKAEPQVRKLLQLVGTELGRELLGYSSVWVDILISSSQNLDKVVVDDARFPNEVRALRDEGFTIIRVSRPESQRMELLQCKYPVSWSSITEHPSETALDNEVADVVLYAESVAELHEQLDKYVN